MQILPTLSCCHLPTTTPIQKRRATNQTPVPEKFTYTVVMFTGRAFFLTVAQAASLPCPPSPPLPIPPPASCHLGKRAQPANTWHSRQNLTPPPRDAMLCCTGGPASRLYTLRQPALANRPRPPGLSELTQYYSHGSAFFPLLTPMLLPTAEQTHAFRRLFQTIPEVASKDWSSGLCSR